MSRTIFGLSREAAQIAPLLANPRIITRMEELSRADQPAVVALEEALDGVRLNRTERQHVGRWVRDTLARHGWRVSRQKRFVGGRIFSSGSVYVRGDASQPMPSAEVPSAMLPAADRLARARALLKAASKTDYGVADYLRDKRAEARREARA